MTTTCSANILVPAYLGQPLLIANTRMIVQISYLSNKDVVVVVVVVQLVEGMKKMNLRFEI